MGDTLERAVDPLDVRGAINRQLTPPPVNAPPMPDDQPTAHQTLAQIARRRRRELAESVSRDDLRADANPVSGLRVQ